MEETSKKASEDKPAEKTSTWFAQISVLVHLQLAKRKMYAQ
jgi:hypothetical protein